MKAVRFSSKGPRLKKKKNFIFMNNLDDFSIRAWDKTSAESGIGVFFVVGVFLLFACGFFFLFVVLEILHLLGSDYSVNLQRVLFFKLRFLPYSLN